jgi:transcriptional regulator with XRE-family HTH domain
MSTRVVAADQGRRAIAHAQRELLRDLRDRRLALGLSQRTVAGAAGIGRSMLGRIERGEIASPDISDLGAMAAVLGLALRIAMYPQGQPIADRVQLRLLAAFRDRIPQSMGWRTEVPLPVAGDRRAWDAVVTLLDGWTAIEGISRLGAVDATIRRAKLKLRDDPRIERLVLVILDTNRNRAALAAAGPTIRDDFPLERVQCFRLSTVAIRPRRTGSCSCGSRRSRAVHRLSTPGEKPWTREEPQAGSSWISRLVVQCLARNVVLARGATRKDRSGGDRLKHCSTRSAEITSMPCRHRTRDYIKGSALRRQLGRFVSSRRVARKGGHRLGARRDVTGIPVSVLPPGVEV